MHNALVLVCEDDRDQRLMIHSQLKSAGIDCYAAATVQEALDRLYIGGSGDVAAVSAVLIDLNVEASLDGLELLDKVRDFDPDIPTFFLTGQRADVSDYPEVETLRKPVAKSELLRKLRPALVRRCKDVLNQQTNTMLKAHIENWDAHVKDKAMLANRVVVLEASAVATAEGVRQACDYANTAANAAIGAAGAARLAAAAANEAVRIATKADSKSLLQLLLEQKKNPFLWFAVLSGFAWLTAQYADFVQVRDKVLSPAASGTASPGPGGAR